MPANNPYLLPVDGLCPRCTNNPATDDPAPCPYDKELGEPPHANCYCCDYCRGECAMDV